MSGAGEIRGATGSGAGAGAGGEAGWATTSGAGAGGGWACEHAASSSRHTERKRTDRMFDPFGDSAAFLRLPPLKQWQCQAAIIKDTQLEVTAPATMALESRLRLSGNWHPMSVVGLERRSPALRRNAVRPRRTPARGR